MHKLYSLFIAAALLLSSCGSGITTIENGTESSAGESISANSIVNLICGSQRDCLSKICENLEKCPLSIALSNKAVFDFVKTYSACEGCNTQAFSSDKGIGSCVEYKEFEELKGWTVEFWVSENCSFRYSDPTHARISVEVDRITYAITRISPDIAYIKDPSFCRMDKDCYGLSGSGVPLIGCSNLLYAPLNLSGYYDEVSDFCECEASQCRQKEK